MKASPAVASGLGLALMLPTLCFAARYTITDLGTLGGSYSAGYGVNESGHVVGVSYTSGDATSHAFLYSGGTMTDLGALGGDISSASGINASAQIVGTYYPAASIRQRAFLYDGTMHDLGTLGGTVSEAHGINTNGQVTGWSTTTGDLSTHAFLYDGAMHDLGSLGFGSSSYANAINAGGQVVGYAHILTGGPTSDVDHAFLYGGGIMSDLGTLGGADSSAYGINANGQIVGESKTAPDSVLPVHAFLYSNGAMRDLGTLGGTNSSAYGINSTGYVVGSALIGGDAVSHAFVYSNGSGMVDLNSFIDPLTGWELSSAQAISDAGQITGYGMIGGQTHGFLLTPVPEPSTFGLAVLACCGVGVFRRAARRFRRREELGLAAWNVVLCVNALLASGVSQASAGDFVIDQSNEVNVQASRFFGLNPQLQYGQEFTPTFSTLNVVDLDVGGIPFGGGVSDPSLLSVNIHQGTITGPIVGTSSNAFVTPEGHGLGSVVQFDFASSVTLVPENLYVIELVPPSTGAAVGLVDDANFQWFAEDVYVRGREIYEGAPLELPDDPSFHPNLFFRTGSTNVPGTVYKTGFEADVYNTPAGHERGEVPAGRGFATDTLGGIGNGWISSFGANATTISTLEPHTGRQAVRIDGASLVPVKPGILGAVVARNSNIDPIAGGNPIVFLRASVRLDGPSTDHGGGPSDDLVSANLGVDDGNGAIVAALILSSNGNAYAFADDTAAAYKLGTPALLGEYHTMGLRLNYLTRTTDYFLDGQPLGALAFGDNIHSNLFAHPFLELLSVDSPALDPALYTAWYDDFSLAVTTAVPEPSTIALAALACCGAAAFRRAAWRPAGIWRRNAP